jgi:phosphoglycolate phosphatase
LQHDAILFDLDGTLVDSLPDIARALNRALAASQLGPLPLDVVRGLVGEGVVKLAEKALAVHRSTLDASALAAEVVAIYQREPCVDSRLYPGIEATLGALRGAGRQLAVLTNKPGRVARALVAALGISHHFEAIVGDGDGHPRKPAPDAARALLTRFGVTPPRALVVGDGLPDLAVARALGAPVAAAAWGYTDRALLAAEKPDFLLETPADLLRIGGG